MPSFMFRRIVNGKLEARTIEAPDMASAQAKLDSGEEDVPSETDEAPVLQFHDDPPPAKQRVLRNMSYLKLAMAELEEELRGTREVLADLDREFPGVRGGL